MLAATSYEALWFLPFALPVALWAAYTDISDMRIPNIAVLALAGVFAVTGLIALPLPEYGWRWVHLAAVLAVGFVMTIAGLVGGGDAKYAAAMAPFIALGDLRFFLALFAACVIAAFVTHRTLRAIPALRRATPHWKSWTHAKFPMGLALSGALILHLAAVALWGQ